MAHNNNYLCGSTCILGVIMHGKLTIANLGDSVATLVRKDSSWTKLNEEHTPNRPDEQIRI
jgi:serine/threonine protein phosphatase PrpC